MTRSSRRVARAGPAGWQALSLERLQFWHRDTARLVAHGARRRSRSSCWQCVCCGAPRPAAKGSCSRPSLHGSSVPRFRGFVGSAGTVVRAVCCSSLPACRSSLLALADPYSALVSQQTSFPGRRISLMIDASTSMTTTFKTETLNTVSKTGPAFFTTVAAAERFVQLRQAGSYRDLMALVEFGDQAYVITPFTSDYDNILLSIALIRDPVEFSLLPGSRHGHRARARAEPRAVQGVRVSRGVGQPDGDLHRRRGHDRARRGPQARRDSRKRPSTNKVPLYFVRTNYDKDLGEIIPDQAWKRRSRRPAAGSTRSATKRVCSARSTTSIGRRRARSRSRTTRASSRSTRRSRWPRRRCWLLAAALKLVVPVVPATAMTSAELSTSSRVAGREPDRSLASLLILLAAIAWRGGGTGQHDLARRARADRDACNRRPAATLTGPALARAGASSLIDPDVRPARGDRDSYWRATTSAHRRRADGDHGDADTLLTSANAAFRQAQAEAGGRTLRPSGSIRCSRPMPAC